jgi:hypothetical protein
MDHEKAKLAVLVVGLGRGFVVADKYDPATRFVITAAHCLPFFPPCVSASTLEDRTYKTLLGPLGRDPTVWGECLFVDPVGDIAVLGSPDREALSEQADEYDALVDGLCALPIAAAPEESRVLLLSLDGRWFQSPVSHSGGPLWLYGADEEIVGGMSGSPIISDTGSAIGVVCNSGGLNGPSARNAGPLPRLDYHLPVWLCPNRIITGKKPRSSRKHR